MAGHARGITFKKNVCGSPSRTQPPPKMEFFHTVPTKVLHNCRPAQKVPHKIPYHMGSRYSTSNSHLHSSPRDTPIRHAPHPAIHLTWSPPCPSYHWRGTERDKRFFSFSVFQFSLEARSPQLLSKEDTFPVSLEFTDGRFQFRPSELDFQSGVIGEFWIDPSDISYLTKILSHPQFSCCTLGSVFPTRLYFSEFVLLFHLRIITSIRTRFEPVQPVFLYNIGLGRVPLIMFIFPQSGWARGW